MKTDIQLPSKEVYEKFQLIFGVDLAGFKDVLMMAMTRRFSFSVFAFDDYCKKYLGYREETDGSLNNFVTKKFGEDACSLIKYLLEKF